MKREKPGYYAIIPSEVRYDKDLKQSIINMIKANIIYYYSEIEYNQLKFIVKGD